MYAPIAEVIVKYFACTDIDGERFLTYDASLPCSGAQYDAWLPAAIFGIIFWIIGLPLLNFCIVYYLARTGTPQNWSQGWP